MAAALAAGDRVLALAAKDRCDRRGMYSIARLIERYGPDDRLPDLRADLTADCSGDGRHSLNLCRAGFPDPLRAYLKSDRG